MTTTTTPPKLPTLKRARADYLASLDKTEERRVAFVDAVRRERETRSWADIARELGLSRQTVMSFIDRDDALKAKREAEAKRAKQNGAKK